MLVAYPAVSTPPGKGLGVFDDALGPVDRGDLAFELGSTSFRLGRTFFRGGLYWIPPHKTKGRANARCS